VADEELAGLLAAGERAAFRGVPGQGLVPLERASALAAEAGDGPRRARAEWLLGVCRTAVGHFGQALAGLTAVVADAELAPEDRSLPASAVAAVQRQLGRHAEARDWDEVARDSAGDLVEASCDAWLGLAADAVGLADPAGAASALERVQELVTDQPQWWRHRIRVDWVRAELALLADEPGQARAAAERALDAAESAGAPRHVAKSLLFAGVAATAQGHPDAAMDLLSRAAVLAEGLGALPLVWPSRALLGALQQQVAPEDAERSLDAARTVIREVALDLPAPLASAWLGRRDIRSLLG
jgi:hypothetical protein